MARGEDDKSEEGNSGLPDCGDAIDPNAFEQILEMDDDSTREFSRELVYGFFDQAGQTLHDMQGQIDSTEDLSSRLHALSQLGHFLKGSSATLGLIKVRDCCEKIQHFGALKDEDGVSHIADEETCLKKIAETMPTLRADCTDSEKRLRTFYEGIAAS